MFDVGNTMMNKAFTSTAGTIFRLGILPVFIFLFLFYRTKLAIFILKLVPHENKLKAVRVLKEFARVVPSYMGGVSMVVLILAIINSSGLLIIGVDHAIVFGDYFGPVQFYSIFRNSYRCIFPFYLFSSHRQLSHARCAGPGFLYHYPVYREQYTYTEYRR